MRQTYHEKEESKKLKQKQKDKMRPRMGRLDIDYRVNTHPAEKRCFSTMDDLDSA